MPSNWVTMYDVQLRYRNAVFLHVANTLADQFGADWFDEEVRVCFSEKEWKTLEEVVEERWATTGLSMPVPPPFERLGVSHVGNIVERHGRYLIEGANRLQPKPRTRRINTVAGLVRQVRAVRDPVSHPPTEELPLRDLVYFTRAAQRALEAFGLDDDAAEVEAVLIDAGKPPSIDVAVSIPPPSMIVHDFVGRDQELSAFRDWFARDDEPVRVIAGGGGTGKSALAYQVALEQAQLPVTRLNFILWLSAKQRQLVRGKTVPVEAEIYDDADVLEKIWNFFGGDDSPDKDTVIELLTETPGLIIADDADSLAGDGGDRARGLLIHDIPHRTKTRVLVTSRRQLFGLETVTTTLAGFSESETGEFVRRRLADLDAEIAFSTSQIAAIRQATDGVPLYIENLLRFIQTLDFESALRQWGTTGGEEPRAYALKREFEEMPAGSRRVLLAAARIGEPASAADISAILRMDDEAVVEAVGDLRNLFFMSRPSFVEGVPRFAVPATTSLLVEEVMGGSFEYEQICKAVDYYLENVDVPWGERGRIGDVFRTIQLLVERQEFDEAERALQQGLTDIPSNPDLLGFRGYLYKHWDPPRLVDADGSFAAAADLHCSSPNMYWQWADLHMSQRDYESAATAAERGLDECGDSPQLLRIAGAARRDTGNRLARKFDSSRALDEYRKARAHFGSMLQSNGNVEPRWRINLRDHYRLNIYLLESMQQVDDHPRYSNEISRLAHEWQHAAPESDEFSRWL